MHTLPLYLKKIMLVVLALQILNLSIYNTSFYSSDTLSTQKAQVKDENPIDSFAEFIVEDIGGIDNAFPEDEPGKSTSKQSGELKHNITFKMVHEDHFEKIAVKTSFPVDKRKAELPLFCNNYSFLFWKEINHPPS